MMNAGHHNSWQTAGGSAGWWCAPPAAR